MNRACSKCNQINPPEAAFCLNCASPLAPVVGAPNQRWQQPVGAGFNAVSKSSGETGQKAVAALILAIVALLCCGPLTGIPAAIVGWLELDSINSGRSSADGKWMAMAGLWGGIAATILHAIAYVFLTFMSLLGGAY